MTAQFSAYVGTPAGPFDEREAASLEGILVHVRDLRAKHPARWPVVVFRDEEQVHLCDSCDRATLPCAVCDEAEELERAYHAARTCTRCKVPQGYDLEGEPCRWCR